MSFDGLEGNRSSGLGTYGEYFMYYSWFNALAPELKDHLIIETSRTPSFFLAHLFPNQLGRTVVLRF